MWKLQGCPRGKGDICIVKESYGWYEQYLQCGYLRNIPSTVEARQHRNLEEEKKELVRLHS
ncbi:hypothetical protein ACFLT4_00560 [Chloroflexota bacterium]